MMSYSLIGCTSAFGSNEFDEKYGLPPTYHNFRGHNKTSFRDYLRARTIDSSLQ